MHVTAEQGTSDDQSSLDSSLSRTLLPGGREIAVIAPLLVLLEMKVDTVIAVVLLLLWASLVFRQVRVGGRQILAEDFLGIAVGLSLLAIASALFVSLVPIPILAAIILAIASIIGLIDRRVSGPQLHASGRQHSPLHIDYLETSFWLSTSLVLVGWHSLGPYSAGLAACHFTSSHVGVVGRKVFRMIAVPLGFVLSFSLAPRFSLQYWEGYDQLLRSTIANSLSRWGYTDYGAAVGTTIHYHWLGEAISGVLSRYSSATAVDSVTRISPVVALLIAYLSLRRLALSLGLPNEKTAVAATMTIALCQIFEPKSIGSLWGITLFLAGLYEITRLTPKFATDRQSLIGPILAVSLLSPMIMLAQTTLGIHFILVCGFVSLAAVLRQRQLLLPLISLLGIQVLQVIVLRKTLLSSGGENIYEPSISLNNVLQFRGLEIYFGENRLFVAFVSVLALLTIVQMGSGLQLLFKTQERRKGSQVQVLAVASSTLVLTNLFSIGGSEAQQARFLEPLIVLISFISLAVLLRAIVDDWSNVESAKDRVVAIVCTGAVVVVLLLVTVRLYNSPWSYSRTFRIGTLILLSVALVVAASFFHRSNGRLSRHRLALSLLLLGLAVSAHGRQLANLATLHRQTIAGDRNDVFLGDREAQDCLGYLSSETPKESIIASNWFRIPEWTRDEKYFLVSAFTERRTYIDGPRYVDGSRPQWIKARVEASDGFAIAPSPSTYAALMSEGVGYFVVNRTEADRPIAKSWEPFATVVFERQGCLVLRLNN